MNKLISCRDNNCFLMPLTFINIQMELQVTRLKNGHFYNQEHIAEI